MGMVHDLRHKIVVAFTKVRLEYGWLGNMSPHPILHDGLKYPTSEHLFQALRIQEDGLVERDGQIKLAREVLRAERSPMAVKWAYKKMIKENPELKRFEPRSDQDVDLMKMVIRLKFHQHRNLADVLCAFQPEVVFIENTGKRRGASAEFWGACQVNEGIWKGSNWLGILLGELKFELKNVS